MSRMRNDKGEISETRPFKWQALVVDDEPVFRDMFRHMLEDLGMQCDEAESAQAAMQNVAERYYDIAFVDIRLDPVNEERLGGLLVIMEIKNARPSLPVVAISAYDGGKDHDRALDAGANLFITKSRTKEHVQKAVRGILGFLDRAGEGKVLRYADIVFNRETRTVVRGNLSIRLTRIEANILSYFMLHLDRVIKISEVYAAAWAGHSEQVRANRVYDEIRSLRDKLMQGGGKNVIHTKYAAGYVFA